MSKVVIFMAEGCEEIEGLAVVDLLRRAKIDIDMVGVTGKTITGSHGIKFETDFEIKDVKLDSYDGYILPGGMPGTTNLGASEDVVSSIKKANAAGKLVAAICAAPSVLGENGLLNGKNATVYPGFEDKLVGATVSANLAVVDDNIITGKGMGAVIDFALEIISYYLGPDKAEEIASQIQYEL